MAKKKEFTILSHHKGRTTAYTGDMDYMLNEVFGYTLECGASWYDNHSHEKNHGGFEKCATNPRTPAQLVNYLNAAAYNCNSYYDSYELG